MSHLDNSNAPGLPVYEKRSHDDRGPHLTKRGFVYGQKLLNIADKYRDLIDSEPGYQEFFLTRYSV